MQMSTHPERFGTVVDRFGIPWLVSCEAPPKA
jgi:uncharacterized glyoxalase superfamily protein PhnB